MRSALARGSEPIGIEIGLASSMIQNWEPQSEFMKRLDAAARAGGYAEGHAEGLREVLLRQIARRFGAVPVAVRDLIEAAPEAELVQWAEDLMFADSLEGLFGVGRGQ